MSIVMALGMLGCVGAEVPVTVPVEAAEETTPEPEPEEADVDTDAEVDTGVEKDDPPLEDTGTVPEKLSGWFQVAEPDALTQSVDVAAANGRIFVSWADRRAGGIDVYVSSSADGAEWSADVRVDDDSVEPQTEWGERPKLAVNGDEVAVTLGDWAASVAQPRIFVSSVSSLDFSTSYAPEAPPERLWKHFASSGFSSSGELWIGWVELGWDLQKTVMLARQSDGFIGKEVSVGARPCDCCGTDFLFTGDGDALFAYRSEEEDSSGVHRNPVLLAADATDAGFQESAQISTTDWMIDACPTQGPGLAEGEEGAFAVWTDSADGPQVVRMATSSDGRNWGDERVVSEGKSPQIAVDDADRVWVTYTRSGSSYLRVSVDGAHFGDELELEAPGGVLVEPVVAADGDTVIIVGSTRLGAVWAYLPESESLF